MTEARPVELATRAAAGMAMPRHTTAATGTIPAITIANGGLALAAGLIGGMALGAILASSARAAPRCYVAPRRVVSASGDTYTRRVRVCR
jgi:hypothetical protein